jgi:hypothetical protein
MYDVIKIIEVQMAEQFSILTRNKFGTTRILTGFAL